MPNIAVHFKETPEGEIHYLPLLTAVEFRILEVIGREGMTGPQIRHAASSDVCVLGIYKHLYSLRDKNLITPKTKKVFERGSHVRKVVYVRTFDTMTPA
ncbi:MAG: hypothetical protein M0P64_00065 [Candidatus Pacebacteria bacterium]|jgi:hypothetical protein|nr:hypothetical protein [Candidatus Paceibacterota bacterium]